ncbi:ATP-binding cassette domain-containing protein [Nitrogeniibacter mangrovi]|uniref:ATP-binding cassette domain-containing protein n=1 Tax=Nitrogeniibacter mangrovi TaxID=2016596 RepID=A0A6C1B2N8_9RHOO|nr:ATP-binding cassette domain-containing protein [Nitrogeniibacter mangrovi]QID17249.1 ATP-binding cassette domain-containing protein [Nitrogeniibacter mangrovi]
MTASHPDLPTDTEAALRVVQVAVGPLQPTDFSIAPGRVTALSGPSGSGKSRLLRALADLDAHDGEVWLGPTCQSRTPAHQWRRRVMLVPADSQWWADTVGEHLPDPARVDWAPLGFEPAVADWQISRLSSGERQRLALLRAVAHGPQALLLDEPTANLDAETTRQVEQWLLELIRTHGWPTLWVSHDRAQVERVADHHLRIDGHTLAEVA